MLLNKLPSPGKGTLIASQKEVGGNLRQNLLAAWGLEPRGLWAGHAGRPAGQPSRSPGEIRPHSREAGQGRKKCDCRKGFTNLTCFADGPDVFGTEQPPAQVTWELLRGGVRGPEPRNLGTSGPQLPGQLAAVLRSRLGFTFSV